MRINIQVLNYNPYVDSSNFKADQEVKAEAIGGSALSKCFLQELNTKELWYAKSGVYVNDKFAEEECFLESCANKIYDYYGIKVARLSIIKDLECHFISQEVRDIFVKEYSRKRSTHVLSRWVDRFNCYEQENAQKVRSYNSSADNFQLNINGQPINEQGLGNILAVALFINDIDVIGGNGENIGYQIKILNNELYALSCKIDPGYAFHDFVEVENNELTRNLRIATHSSSSGETLMLDFNNLPKRTRREFVETIKNIIDTRDEHLEKIFKFYKPFMKEKVTTIISCLKKRREQLRIEFNVELTNISPLVQLDFVERPNEWPPELKNIYHDYKLTNLLLTQDDMPYIELAISPQPYEGQSQNQMNSLFNEVCDNFLKHKTEEKILLLLGNGGTGKSRVVRNLQSKLLEALFSNNQISVDKWVPIYIQLKYFSDRTVKNCIENTLRDDYKLTIKEINNLKTRNCLFILDGFDEISSGLKLNFWETNKLNLWPKAKMLITSRIDYLQPGDLNKYFIVPNTENSENSSIVRYLVPLNNQQIVDFLSRNIENNFEYWNNILKQSTLKSILEIPLLLSIFKKNWRNMRSILEQHNNKLNRFRLYQASIEQLFGDSINRLIESGERNLPDSQGLYLSAEKLAFDMYSLKKITISPIVNYKEALKKSDIKEVFKKDLEKAMQTTASAWPLRGPIEEALVKRGYLIRKDEQQYSFIHKSFLEYFVAKRLWKDIKEDDENEFFISWNSRNVTEEPEIIKFLSELFNEEIYEQQEIIRKKLIHYIKQTKKNNNSKAAAGAISFLNSVKTSFSKEDLSQIDISGSDLTGAVLDGTILEKSNLTNTKLNGAWLHNAKLKGSNLSGVEFGELPYFRLHNEYKKNRIYAFNREYFATTIVNCVIVYKIDFNNSCNIEEHKVIDMSSFTTNISGISFNHSNTLLALYSSDKGEVYYFSNLTDNNKISIVKIDSKHIQSIAFSPNDKWLAIVGEKGKIHIKNLDSDQQKILHFEEEISSIIFVNDEELAYGDSNGTLSRVNLNSEINEIIHHSTYIRSIELSPNKKWLAILSGKEKSDEEKKIILYDLISCSVKILPYSHTNKVTSVSFSSNGKWLVSGSFDKTIRIWSLNNIDDVKVLKGHTDYVGSVYFSPDDRLLLSGSDDQTVRFWDIESLVTYNRCHFLTGGHGDYVYGVSFNPDGTILASGSRDKTIRFYKSTTMQEIKLLAGHDNFIYSIAFSHNQRWLASGDADGTVKFWTNENDEEELLFQSNEILGKTLGSYKKPIRSVSFSINNKWLAAGCEDNFIYLHNLNNLNMTARALQSHTGAVYSVAFSIDSIRLASGSMDNTIRIWNLNTLQVEHVLKQHSSCVDSVTFSPDSKWLASGSWDKQICIWQGFKVQTVLYDHIAEVNVVAFSKNSEYLFSGDYCGTLMMWKLLKENWQKLHGVKIGSNVFSISTANKELVATGCADHSVRLWEHQREQLTLLKTTHQVVLCADHADISEVYGLSNYNTRLLQQNLEVSQNYVQKKYVMLDQGGVLDGEVVYNRHDINDNDLILYDFNIDNQLYYQVLREGVNIVNALNKLVGIYNYGIVFHSKNIESNQITLLRQLKEACISKGINFPQISGMAVRDPNLYRGVTTERPVITTASNAPEVRIVGYERELDGKACVREGLSVLLSINPIDRYKHVVIDDGDTVVEHARQEGWQAFQVKEGQSLLQIIEQIYEKEKIDYQEAKVRIKVQNQEVQELLPIKSSDEHQNASFKDRPYFTKMVEDNHPLEENSFNNLTKNQPERCPIGLNWESVDGDGDCLYYAVSLYLGQDVVVLRQAIALHLEENIDTYREFITLPTGRTIEEYIDDIRYTHEWAGDLEINVLSQLLNRPIIAVGSNSQIFNRSILDKGLNNDEPIFVYYNNVNHYDGLILQQTFNGKQILDYLLTLESQDTSDSQDIDQLRQKFSKQLIFSDQKIIIESIEDEFERGDVLQAQICSNYPTDSSELEIKEITIMLSNTTLELKQEKLEHEETKGRFIIKEQEMESLKVLYEQERTENRNITSKRCVIL